MKNPFRSIFPGRPLRDGDPRLDVPSTEEQRTRRPAPLPSSPLAMLAGISPRKTERR